MIYEHSDTQIQIQLGVQVEIHTGTNTQKYLGIAIRIRRNMLRCRKTGYINTEGQRHIYRDTSTDIDA